MAIDGFTEIFNTIYIIKKLSDMGKDALVKGGFFDVLDLDTYYDGLYGLIENLFEHHYARYHEYRCVEFHVLSDPVIEDFYKLAGEYGKRSNIAVEDNPYIKNAEHEVAARLNFSYCLGWKLMGHTEPKRPYHSRLGLFIYQDDFVDLGCLAYALIEIYEWFADTGDRLRDMLRDSKPVVMLNVREAIAA